MAEIVYMPKLSDTMTEGVVAAWNKKIGDEVKEGDILAGLKQIKPPWNLNPFMMEFCYTSVSRSVKQHL